MLRALRDRSSWREDLRSMALAVNVSGRDLLDRALPGDVRTFVGDVTPTSSLKLEVTESVLSADPALIERTANELHALGIGLSIDDFGTGGSSLTHLARLPVSEVKIDRSFVSMMRTDARRRAIVRSTIELAHALGSRVVAEGVEDRETWDLLADMGCDAAQGYLVARPMPPEALIAWVGSRSAAVN
jgi:EAL domain-containing protein (putative c-di-GMP-specific phosphodiesterase class I)